MHLTTPIRNEDGFSLLEIITVILIIGVLAGIAVPAFSYARGTGHDSMVRAHVGEFKGQVEEEKKSNPNFAIDPAFAHEFSGKDGVILTVAPNPETEDYGDYLITGWHENGFKYTQDDPMVENSNDPTISVKKYSR